MLKRSRKRHTSPRSRTTQRGRFSSSSLAQGSGVRTTALLIPSHFACILHVSQTSPRYILGYTSNTSRYMYLGRFLGVTLDTCQDTSKDTSRYVYLGLFIRIHQDTPRYKITIHVSWTRHYEYMWDTCKDLCGIHAGYMYLQWFQDT
jgi:hypothetical protein